MALPLVPNNSDDVAEISELRAVLVQALAKADQLDLSMTGIHLVSAITEIDAALAEWNAAKSRDDSRRSDAS